MEDFLAPLKPEPEVLDVGCGNCSSLRIKSLRPDCRYVGLDVCDFLQSPESIAQIDEYIIADGSGAFNAAIRARAGRFDAVISHHNIEHCDSPQATLQAMIAALRPSGRLFMAFPCAESVHFPSREGTLNFYDDPTHKRTPPDFDQVRESLVAGGLRILGAARRYRPPREVLLGIANERRSARRQAVLAGTWGLYGFESVIWAERPN